MTILQLVPDMWTLRAGVLLRFVSFALLCAVALGPNLSAAQSGQTDSADQTQRPIEVLHTPLATIDIPPVGSLMKITLSLSNTVDIQTKVRLVGSKDGRFIDIAFPRGALDNSDRPTFSVEIPSPVAAMTYQFIVHQRDGTLTSSRKFVAKRRCLQTFSINVQDDKRTTAFRREVASRIAQAGMLERDNKSLEASLKLLEEIKSSLSR